jgi:hypothetical protein
MSEADPKAINLIRGIWYGEFATCCDGNIYGYSRLMHILFSVPTKQVEKDVAYLTLVTNAF